MKVVRAPPEVKRFRSAVRRAVSPKAVSCRFDAMIVVDETVTDDPLIGDDLVPETDRRRIGVADGPAPTAALDDLGGMTAPVVVARHRPLPLVVEQSRAGLGERAKHPTASSVVAAQRHRVGERRRRKTSADGSRKRPTERTTIESRGARPVPWTIAARARHAARMRHAGRAAAPNTPGMSAARREATLRDQLSRAPFCTVQPAPGCCDVKPPEVTSTPDMRHR